MSKNDTLAKQRSDTASGTDWARLAAMTDEAIDLSDIPELTEEQLQNMRPTEELIPALTPKGKTRITIRLDDEIIAFFKQQASERSSNYQTLINAALHYFVVRQQKKDDLQAIIRQVVQEELANIGE